MKSIEGHASVTIRKQNQLFLYDFEMEIYYICVRDYQDKFEAEDEKSVKGTFKVHEFNQDNELKICMDKKADATFLINLKMADKIKEVGKVISALKTFLHARLEAKE